MPARTGACNAIAPRGAVAFLFERHGQMQKQRRKRAAFDILGLDHVVLRVPRSCAADAVLLRCARLPCRARAPELGLMQLRAGVSLIDLIAVDGELGRAGGAAPGKPAAIWITCACASSPSIRMRCLLISYRMASRSVKSNHASARTATGHRFTSATLKATSSN